MSPLTAWANFYVIVGSSAGALIGLTFVVITLLAGRQGQGTSWGVAAFNTPTVVNFGTVLLVAAILSAPWSSLVPVAVLLAFCGFAGMAYSVVVVRRLRRRIGYDLEREDWLWYAIVPPVAYTALLVLAVFLPGNPTPALFGIGAVIVLVLFLAIHNAWDLVTYIAIENLGQHTDEKSEKH